MNKPDYELEKSKAKRAADLIEFAEEVLQILNETGRMWAAHDDPTGEWVQRETMLAAQRLGLFKIPGAKQR